MVYFSLAQTPSEQFQTEVVTLCAATVVVEQLQLQLQQSSSSVLVLPFVGVYF